MRKRMSFVLNYSSLVDLPCIELSYQVRGQIFDPLIRERQDTNNSPLTSMGPTYCPYFSSQDIQSFVGLVG